MIILATVPAIAQNVEANDDNSDGIVLTDSIADEPVVQDSVATDSLPWPQSLQRRIDDIIDKSTLLNSTQLGLMVYDLDTDSTLYAYNAKQTMRPASTMKLITAITALDRLGGSYQFKTRLRYTGEITDSTRTLAGNVYIIGGMDPRFNRDDMIAFAEAIHKLGVDTLRGVLCADRSMKHPDLLGEGWCWDDDNPVLSPLVYGRKDNMLEKFIGVLKDCGVYADVTIEDRRCPGNAKDLCTRTHSIDQILMKMMKDSDNLYAECMFYNMASSQSTPATAAHARSIEQNIIRKMKMSPSRYRIADGSGLSLYNYVSPELEVAFLKYAYRNSNIYNHLYPSLPIAGIDGTLSKRMRRTKAEGNVHAKTGTLTGISSLAGYAKAANGHNLCFCIINQGVLSSQGAKNFQDKICMTLVR